MPRRRTTESAARPRCAPRAAAAVALALLLAAVDAAAQRVQIPAGPTYGALPQAAPVFDPYNGAVPSIATPVAPGAYGLPSPSFAQPAPALGAPQAFGAPPLGASPYDAPLAPGFSATAPAYDPGAPPSGHGFGPDHGSLGWQPGTYGFEQSGGGVTRFRQFLARLRGEHTFLLSAGGADEFELNRTEVAATFAVPWFGNIDKPLLISPGFAFNWFEGPVGDPAPMAPDPRGPDLPPVAYDAYVDFAMFPQFTPGLGAELGFRTGVWTDFDEVNSDSLRFLGRGLGVVTLSPTFDILLGVVYLDRLEVKLLPAGGVRWRPTPLWDLYLVFPNPKVRRTIVSAGGVSWWWFAAGEYGGGSWTVDRAGFGDRIDYNDLRVTLGLEWETPGQTRGHLEIGYAFEREIVFESGDPVEFEPDDAILFRAGIGY